MKVAVELDYKTDRKESFGNTLRRIAAAFDSAGLEAVIGATFSDRPIHGGASAIDRALKKYPALAPFDRQRSLPPGGPPTRVLMNHGPAEPFPLESVLLLADGLPRSFPFSVATVTFTHEQFGDFGVPDRLAGILATDYWSGNGRSRSLAAFFVVEGDASAKSLPQPPAPVAAVLSVLGKATKTRQYLVPTVAGDPVPAPQPATENAVPAPPPAAVATETPAPVTDDVRALVRRYREGMPAMVARLALPYDLPPTQEALREAPTAAGSRKPALVEAFKPRGFTCRFESGTFTLRRRTPDNHVVDLVADVGTWSHMVTATYAVHGPGFRAAVPLPVSARAVGQYPIGGTERWGQIVANLAVIVDELDQTFLPELEEAVGRAPEWFEPGR